MKKIGKKHLLVLAILSFFASGLMAADSKQAVGRSTN
jgi:hypothetical protein